MEPEVLSSILRGCTTARLGGGFVSADTVDLPHWDPDQYARFEAERDRPALDLLLRLPADLDPAVVWDLGCGAGQHAALLKRRHPAAAVHGLDSSADMIARARARTSGVDWRTGDIGGWAPERPVDLIFSNAALHWLQDHGTLIPRLAAALAPGGVLAVQMPLAHDTAHHAAIRAVAAEGDWAEVLAGVGRMPRLPDAATYYDLLARDCADIDIWSTTYIHALPGPDPVLEWISGTALRPYLTALDAAGMSRGPFLDALSARLAAAFPPRADGVTLLPFPRLFLVARRRS